jgi:thiol-disulfide isomerase/thioredoxin
LNCRALRHHLLALVGLLGTAEGRAAPAPEIVTADLAAVQAAIHKPGARAVLVNVWASFCDPCKEEMPGLLRVWKQRQAQGLRLVLISADDQDNLKEAQKFLAKVGVDFPTYLKTGDDMAFINGLEPRWSGALPASILFDGAGHTQEFWPGEVSAADLATKIDALLKKNHGRSR